MLVIVFRSRLRSGVDPSPLEPLGRLYELASGMPGFISYNYFDSADGESVSIVEFESRETRVRTPARCPRLQSGRLAGGDEDVGWY